MIIHLTWYPMHVGKIKSEGENILQNTCTFVLILIHTATYNERACKVLKYKVAESSYEGKH